MNKPTTSSGYPIGLAVQARRMCLYVATLLGDLKLRSVKPPAAPTSPLPS
jgi:hypothetical protein